jgi:hypothetical protein
VTSSSNKPKPPQDSRLIEQFLEMMSAERGASRHTLSAYGRDLLDYTQFLAQAGMSARQARLEDVRAFLAKLSSRQLAKASAARKLSAVVLSAKVRVLRGIEIANSPLILVLIRRVRAQRIGVIPSASSTQLSLVGLFQQNLHPQGR